MADVFISYASEQRLAAGRLADAVQGLGHSVWWDRKLLPHQGFRKIIERELDGSRCVIVLWCETARESEWVCAEANRALDGGRLIQATLDGRLPPLPFDQFQMADLRGWNGEAAHGGWQEVAESLGALLGGEAVAAPPRVQSLMAKQPPAPPRKIGAGDVLRAVPGWIVAAVLAVALVAALPLVLGRMMLTGPLAFLADPLTSLLIVVLMVGLLFALPRLPRRALNLVLALALVGALGAGVAYSRTVSRFVLHDVPSDGDIALLGCGVTENTCSALRGEQIGCSSPQAMCPFMDGQAPATVLDLYSYDPGELYGADGIKTVEFRLWLAWNGLFAAIALFVAAILSQALKPFIARLMREEAG